MPTLAKDIISDHTIDARFICILVKINCKKCLTTMLYFTGNNSMTLTFTGLYLLAAMIQVGSLLKLANKLVNLLWSKGTVYILGQLAS